VAVDKEHDPDGAAVATNRHRFDVLGLDVAAEEAFPVPPGSGASER
jgi:hypothetical protein